MIKYEAGFKFFNHELRSDLTNLVDFNATKTQCTAFPLLTENRGLVRVSTLFYTVILPQEMKLHPDVSMGFEPPTL